MTPCLSGRRTRRLTTKTNKILDTVHETAQGLHSAGVMGVTTMREFDALCLPPVEKPSAAQIRRLRTQNKASQAVFAAYLNTSLSTGTEMGAGAKNA